MPPTQKIVAISTIWAFLATRHVPELAVRQSFTWTAVATFATAFFTWIVWAVLIYPNYVSVLRDLPSPPNPSLFMGHADRIAKEPTGIVMREWTNTVPNEGLIRYLHWFNNERILVTGARALGEVLVTKNYDFAKPAIIRTGLARILGVGLILAEGDEHKRQRKHLAPAFAYRHIENLHPTFWAKVVELVERVHDDMANSPPGHTHAANVVEVGDYASRASLDVIGLAGMGRDFGAIADPDNPLSSTYKAIFVPSSGRARFLQIASLLFPTWLMRIFPSRRNFAIVAARNRIRTTCQTLIAIKRRNHHPQPSSPPPPPPPPPPPAHDILSVAIDSHAFSDHDLTNQMMTFLVAGHETTATAMLWALYCLCRHPIAQTRLRAEIHACLPSPRTSSSSSSSSSTCISPLAACPYLAAVCNEVLRLWAPLSLTLRVAVRDTVILQHSIPKGTMLVLCPWATNVATAQWGAQAADFLPERWLTGKQVGGAKSPYSMLTFLHGPRACIGERFARAELAALLAVWVGRFESSLETLDFVPEIQAGVTSKPKGGLWVRLRECEEW